MIQTTINVPFEVLLSGQDPGLSGTMTIEVYDPTNGASILPPSGVGISEPRPGAYRAERVVAVPGTFAVRWVRTDTSAVLFEQELLVGSYGVVAPSIDGELLTLAEYRAAVGIDVTDTRNDARFESLLPFVSDAIRSFTERDFGAPTITEERIFEYDGSGYLDIDDASDVQSVAYTYPNSGVSDLVLSSDAWTPRPQRRDDAPIFYYIAIGGGWAFGGISPEMGFERNLDVWVREHGFAGGGGQVKVGATWGWPLVPGAVKMAAIWTMQAWLSRPQGQGLTAEAIEGWSRSWGSGASGATPRLAIPDEARDLLVQFSKGI